jgi:hypothetical protein
MSYKDPVADQYENSTAVASSPTFSAAQIANKHSIQIERLEVVETGRRRRWSDDEKLRSFWRRHGIC